MKIYNLKIWRWDKLLHEGDYQFETLQLAQTFHLGLYNGFELCGLTPTGMELKEQN